jgi:hypothetical protein
MLCVTINLTFFEASIMMVNFVIDSMNPSQRNFHYYCVLEINL